MSDSFLRRSIPFELGPLSGRIFGGPYKAFIPGTRRLYGIKMAKEIYHPFDCSVPTEDFSVPDKSLLDGGVCAALHALHFGKDIYVGCMGGVGRTGLFMGVMAKLMKDCQDFSETSETSETSLKVDDPVKFVRYHYLSSAIETELQQAFVRGYDTEFVRRYFDTLVAKNVEVKEVKVYASPLESFLSWFGVRL